MPEAVIVATARSPIGRAFKGSLKDERPDDLAAAMVHRGARQNSGLRPARTTGRAWTTSTWAAPSPAARPVPTWPGWSPSWPAWTTSRPPPSTASAPPACRPSGWPSTPSRPAKGTRSSPPGWSGVPVPRLGRRRRDGRRAPTTRSLTPPGSAPPPGPRPTPRGPIPGSGGRMPDIYIVHGPDRRERRHQLRHQPGRAGRLGGAEPEPRRGAIASGFYRPRDHAVHAQGRHRGRPGRLAPGRRHPRSGQRPAAGLPHRGNRHGRQRLPAQRRCRRRRGDERLTGPGTRAGTAGADRLHRRQRPLPRAHGHGSGRSDPAGPGSLPGWPIGRHRPGGTQRGLRRPGGRQRPGTGDRSCTGSTSTVVPSPWATRSA